MLDSPDLDERSSGTLERENPAAKAIFDKYDEDRTGSINVLELQARRPLTIRLLQHPAQCACAQAMCEEMGKEMDIEAAWQALKALDRAGDGMISCAAPPALPAGLSD